MKIRFAQAGDVPGIVSLLRQVGQVHHQGRPDIFRRGAQKYDQGQILAMLDKPEIPIFIAAEGAAVLGYCFCFVKEYRGDPVIADHTELYIDNLCVDEACRGRQVGKTLYRAACDHARQIGCYNVTLNVWSCNESAMGFYKALGMQPQKTGMETIL